MRSLAEKRIDVSAIQTLYRSDASARAVFDWLARRKEDIQKSYLDRIASDLKHIPRAELVRVLRKLQNLGCGRFVVGRKGMKSRFLWSVRRRELGKVAAGQAAAAAVKLVPYKIQLRPSLFVAFDLPDDLTSTESKRLVDFISALVPEVVP